MTPGCDGSPIDWAPYPWWDGDHPATRNYLENPPAPDEGSASGRSDDIPFEEGADFDSRLTGQRELELASSGMAWRIEEEVVRGEIDNRVRDRVTGRIWLAGREEAIVLELAGNPWRDLAGQVLRFSNPNPNTNAKPGDGRGLAAQQGGVVGDMTASRKVKVPECSREELHGHLAAGEPFPWHWGNALYLEWFSECNGRVVIESADYELELLPVPAMPWAMSDEEEAEQRLANSRVLTAFMDRLVTAAGGQADLNDDEADDDAPQSAAEAEADAEAARMNLLLDRVTARLDREGNEEGNFERILEEERERLRLERGEPKEELSAGEEEERERWIEEMNAAADEAIAEMEAESWKEEEATPARQHPLVERCSDLSLRLHREVEESGWIREDAQREHPLIEIVSGTMSASAKLAGALGMSGEDDWPPSALFAGDKLVRLKKGRDYLRDVIRGLDSADEEKLAPVSWRAEVRREIGEILGEVQERIHEVRQVLADEE